MQGNYRPLRFRSVIGQPVAMQLIKNALAHDKLPRTMILYGPSGTGKTTIARLIAAWFVCENRGADDVCGECDMCKAVQIGSLTDIVEFDAASHTSIDDIREILDQCAYAPQLGSQKIFIIDEAHMLSRNAIAAFLKMFEETASHVRFILATTEIEKISDAIRSRCFCVAMQEINHADMRSYLNGLAQFYRVTISEHALGLIVKLSRGSMREAISIFEQAMFLGENIDSNIVYSIVAFADDETIKKLSSFLMVSDYVSLFDELNVLMGENSKANVSAISLLLQLIFQFKDMFDIKSADRTKVLKILIDLNKLYSDSSKVSCFSEMIIIGLAQIAYSN